MSSVKPHIDKEQVLSLLQEHFTDPIHHQDISHYVLIVLDYSHHHGDC